MRLTSDIAIGNKRRSEIINKFLKKNREDFKDYNINIRVKDVLSSHSEDANNKKPVDSKIKMPQLVMRIEFGSGNTPPRPFIRTAVSHCKKELKDMVSAAYASKLRNRHYDINKKLRATGAVLVDQILEEIHNGGQFAPLAKQTINRWRKGKDTTPLVDFKKMGSYDNPVFFSTVTNK